MQVQWQLVTALHFECFLLSSAAKLYRSRNSMYDLDLYVTTSFLWLFFLFTLKTESMLSALGLFVLPTISSLIASLNRETVQYFRANILCKSCHSFHSLKIDILTLSILEMKLGSNSILKNLMPLTPFKSEELCFQTKALSFQVSYFWTVWLEILQTCISEAARAPTPQDACCCESCTAVKGCVSNEASFLKFRE